MPVNLSPYLLRPEHIVTCAVAGCNRKGLRSDVCYGCREYHCTEHLHAPIVGNQADWENICTLIDPANMDEQRCFPCGNAPARVGRARADAQENIDASLARLKTEMEKSPLRKQFGVLLLDRFQKLIEQVDLLESYLEKQLWAALYVRGLDHYVQPQVKVYDYDGEYIVRVDFASTLLRIALFTDGHEFHDPPAQQQKDQLHNERLRAMGWLVQRYWYEDVVNDLNARADQIYDLVCQRIARMQDTGIPIALENPDGAAADPAVAANPQADAGANPQG